MNPDEQNRALSRRVFLGTTAGTGMLLGANPVRGTEPEHFRECLEELHPNPIPGGIAPFAPFAILIHHRPPTPGIPLADINEPSQITDFKGFVGITRIRGAGIGTDTTTGATMNVAYSADMGFSQGNFIGADGRRHFGTFVFV